MLHVIPVLWAALFTIATAWSLGCLFFRTLSLPLQEWEDRLLAYIAGISCLSAIMFLLCATRLVRRGILLALGLAIIGYAIYSGVFRFSGNFQSPPTRKMPALPNKALAPLPTIWRWIFGLGFAVFTYFGFFNALAPEHSSDGMSYHLAEVAKYSRAHGFLRITTDVYANLSQGIELVYLFAFDFGRHSAATLVHYSFLIALVFLILCYGRRIGRPDVGAAAALFTYACPIVLRDATIAYVDVALAANLFALFYLLQIWDENRNSKLLLPIGLLAGFGYEIKYTAIVAVPYAVGFVLWKLLRSREPDPKSGRNAVWRPALIVSAVAISCILPWMVKDWIEVANPVSPFANRIFPNPYVHVSFEENWRASLATYGLPSRSQIPLQVTVQGDRVEGFLGPLFLLSPLALIALRYRAGRQLLLAAAIFGVTYWGNIGTRFLIPVVPFISLALALVLSDVKWLLPIVAVAHCLTCMPDLYRHYCAPGAYRIENAPVKAALRIQPEAAYLGQDPTIQVDRMVEANVPPGETIF